MYTPEIPMHTLDDIRATLLVPNQYIRWYVHAANTLIFPLTRVAYSPSPTVCLEVLSCSPTKSLETLTHRNTQTQSRHITHTTRTRRDTCYTRWYINPTSAKESPRGLKERGLDSRTSAIFHAICAHPAQLFVHAAIAVVAPSTLLQKPNFFWDASDVSADSIVLHIPSVCFSRSRVLPW